jgi:Tfp pilus assembly protein PilF
VPWYEEALRRRAEYPQALRALAVTLAAAGDLTRAASVGERAAAVLPSDTAVLTNLGCFWHGPDRWTERWLR